MQILAVEFIKRNTKLIEALKSVYVQNVVILKELQGVDKENEKIRKENTGLKKLLQLYIKEYGIIKTTD